MATSRERLEELRAIDAGKQVLTPRQRLEMLRAKDDEAAKAELSTNKTVEQQRENYGEPVVKNDQYQIGNPETFKQRVFSAMDSLTANTAGIVEPVMSVASSAALEPVAGVAGLASAPYLGVGGGSEVIKNIQGYAYTPKTQQGQSNMRAIGETIQPYAEPVINAIDAAADYGYEKTGSPLVGAAIKTAPAALLEYLGLKGFSSLRKGTRLISKTGEPTKELAVILNKKGLNFKDLTPEARKAIPEFADPKLLPSPKSEGALVGADIQSKQLISGGRDNALAPFGMVDGVVKPQKIYQDAIKQGWREGTVQMVKTSNAQTKKIMRDMLDKRWSLLKTDSSASVNFPMNAVGDAFYERIKYITGRAKKARFDLDRIAKTKLVGVQMDTKPISDKFFSMMDDLEVSYTVNNKTGVPKLNYKGSIIQADTASKKAINTAIELLSTGTDVSAYRFHKLKRQLDTLIDYKKVSKTGLSKEGKKVLKGLRHELKEQLNSRFDDYAKVNNELHSILTGMDDFKRAAKVDIDFLDDPGPAIGQEMRKLHTNYKSRPLIAQSADNIDALANSLGGNFSSNYEDLAQFGNRMDEMFGSSKSGSFQGLTEVGTAYATEGTIGGARAAGRAAKEKYKDIMHGDYFPAYQSMHELLK